MTHAMERRTLIALDAFLAVTAISGGLAMLTGWIDMPVEWLSGSPLQR